MSAAPRPEVAPMDLRRALRYAAARARSVLAHVYLGAWLDRARAGRS